MRQMRKIRLKSELSPGIGGKRYLSVWLPRDLGPLTTLQLLPRGYQTPAINCSSFPSFKAIIAKEPSVERSRTAGNVHTVNFLLDNAGS